MLSLLRLAQEAKMEVKKEGFELKDPPPLNTKANKQPQSFKISAYREKRKGVIEDFQGTVTLRYMTFEELRMKLHSCGVRIASHEPV